ncbi:MAG: phytanoyl-CoA dioxygenase family protein [Ferruginibacter sp.]|nr:phytanoyl-CoA dioxygenase family protein [Ferruginibacter sp.]
MREILNNQADTIAPSTDTGNTGIPHLKRLWYKLNDPTSAQNYNEAGLDAALLNVLGLGLLPTYDFFFHNQPSLQVFEQWVLSFYPGGLPEERIKECYALLEPGTDADKSDEPDVLSESDLLFWKEKGYVIVRNAIEQQDCLAARQAIWEYLHKVENDPSTWYDNGDQLQGIMVPLYRHAAIDKNRNAGRIKKAFEQVWNQTGLIFTTDKCGFNAPETAASKYKGIGLHWDVSLVTPIPFGTQGILYLTDTAANQGALTVVPGFHKKIESWLQSLPPNINPRQTDLSIFNPVPIAANAGDLIIWDHRLPHSSSPNRANFPRLVQYINWYSPQQKQQQEWI